MVEILEHVVDLAGDIIVFGTSVLCVIGVGFFVFAMERQGGFDVGLSVSISDAVLANCLAGSHGV